MRLSAIAVLICLVACADNGRRSPEDIYFEANEYVACETGQWTFGPNAVEKCAKPCTTRPAESDPPAGLTCNTRMLVEYEGLLGGCEVFGGITGPEVMWIYCTCPDGQSVPPCE